MRRAFPTQNTNNTANTDCVRCPSCNRKFRTNTLADKTTATIICDGQEYVINKNVLVKSIPNFETLTSDELEDHLLLKMEDVISDRAVLKLITKHS